MAKIIPSLRAGMTRSIDSIHVPHGSTHEDVWYLSTAKQGIMHLVAFVHLSVRLSICLSVLSQLNRLTYDLNFWHGGQP